MNKKKIEKVPVYSDLWKASKFPMVQIWDYAISDGSLHFLTPNYGEPLRSITEEEFNLYKNHLASPIPPGLVVGDYLY